MPHTIPNARWAVCMVMLVLGAFAGEAQAQVPDCTLAGWVATPGVVEGSPNNPPPAPPVPRYSGLCAIQTDAVGEFLSVSHAEESAYFVRFYYYTGNWSGGTVDIYQARDGVNAVQVKVQHAAGTSNQLRFSADGGVLRTAPVVANRWYAIELGWTAGASGTLAITVTGAGSDTPLAITPISGLNNDSTTITQSRMGLISGSGSGAVGFDAFELRRDASPGRLVRGDATGNGVVNVGDAIVARNEALGGALSPGQPDCNEDGVVNVGDSICIRNLALDP
jgi:hypothetical protein